MSSALTVLSDTGTRNGAVQVVSLVVEWATHTWSSVASVGCGFVKVTHSRFWLSRAMVTDSMAPEVTDFGKPLSIVYLSVVVLYDRRAPWMAPFVTRLATQSLPSSDSASPVLAERVSTTVPVFSQVWLACSWWI